MVPRQVVGSGTFGESRSDLNAWDGVEGDSSVSFTLVFPISSAPRNKTKPKPRQSHQMRRGKRSESEVVAIVRATESELRGKVAIACLGPDMPEPINKLNAANCLVSFLIAGSIGVGFGEQRAVKECEIPMFTLSPRASELSCIVVPSHSQKPDLMPSLQPPRIF